MNPLSVVDTVTGTTLAAIIASLALVTAVLSARLLAVRALGRSRLLPDVKARWFQQIRTVSIVVVLAGLLGIWTHELRELAFSLAAIAVAFVISLKELILCLHGSFLRTSSRAFSVGDRILAAGFRGDVVETGALTTTLLEVAGTGSKQTGRAVVIPNSAFIDKPIVNESYAGEYGLFTMSLPVQSEKWSESERVLLEAANTACAGYLEDAREHIDSVGWQKGLGPDGIQPSVTVEASAPGELILHLRFPAPTRVRGQVEQDILRGYLTRAPAAEAPTPGGVSAGGPSLD